MYVFVRQCVNAKEYITACELRIYVGCLPLFLANSCARERPKGIAEEATSRSQDIPGTFVVLRLCQPVEQVCCRNGKLRLKRWTTTLSLTIGKALMRTHIMIGSSSGR